ncbi:MAG: bifunctional 5,10-methylene-tetrahydrofolate dehydrogenase/5,10-methylene-tetrahydrofolate cyclohydrolase [Treponema sp.]|jgi:methylenetetrahydrofolate dehydrogenase (NADP+)/methenyltetrahydrofolate cyclohydrolase|nr:bifunctional 5,10-methylene-tetrahydrofolate dehydrogenase/5,10-methylene-tetrahydrofolate cyclohydrolase [Treponema sp.]
MAAVVIDGKSIGLKVRQDVKKRVQELKPKGIIPKLAVILAGENPASLSYVAAKEKALSEDGMECCVFRLDAGVPEAGLLSLIDKLNKDAAVHGILVQHPLPDHINGGKIFAAIEPAKDVDCFNPVSVGNMVLGKKCFLPCTPHGILVLLLETRIELSGSHAVVIGRSNIVGKPLVNLLAGRDVNATVTICHTGTKDTARFTRQADIVIAAAGKSGLVTADMVKDGAVVIDVGMNRVSDPSKSRGYRLCGDVDFPAVAEKASYITPVPGGVGPMTIAMLMYNVAQACLPV